jgi:hypothetical protein
MDTAYTTVSWITSLRKVIPTEIVQHYGRMIDHQQYQRNRLNILSNQVDDYTGALYLKAHSI